MSDCIDKEKVEDIVKKNITWAMVAATVSVAAAVDTISEEGSKLGKKHINRVRKSVDDIHASLGDNYFRKAYRMDHFSFWRLHKVLFGSDFIKKRKRGVTPNGDILKSQRLSMALRRYKVYLVPSLPHIQ